MASASELALSSAHDDRKELLANYPLEAETVLRLT